MKIFIINLKRAIDRKEAMLKKIQNLKNQGSKEEFIFFDAIDAKEKEHEYFKMFFSSFWTKVHRAKDSTDGEKACYASHFCLWQKCIELNEPIIVLEDDINFAPHFLEGLERIKNSGYEYVRLRAIKMPKKRYIIYLKDYFALLIGDVAGTQGYYLTPSAAKKFIHNTRYWSLPVDIYMDKTYKNKVKNIIHTPYLITIDDFESTIPNRYNNEKKSSLYKLMREFFRIFFIIVEKSYHLKQRLKKN